MSPDKMRVAIAEACGIERIWSFALPTKTISCNVPDYLNDLNALLEAEALLIVKRQLGQDYIVLLDDICGDDYGYYHATAEQKCEAILKLLDLWKEQL